jgi:ornithine cyclodeaminase
MKILILNRAEVQQLLPMAACIELMAQTLATLARDEAVNPLRHLLRLPDRSGLMGMMPAYLANINAVGIKVITVFPRNEEEQHDSHQGGVMLFDGQQGRPLALVDAGAITAVRTAAVSGVATRLLARQDASDLAILGSGVQAASHLEAMLHARTIGRVRVWSRNLDHVQTFAQAESEKHGLRVEAMDSAKATVTGADIICTTTAASEPVLLGEWLSPGAHINAVGSSVPFARELDTPAVLQSRLFVDRRESTLNEAGDFLFPKQEGAIEDEHIRGEIGEILLGRVKGRESNKEITLFKSLGLAVEDVASAHFAYYQAIEKGLGTWVEW